MGSEVIYMKQFLIVFLVAVTSFAITVSGVIKRWENSQYIAYRFFVEESKSPKMRYEKVYKKGEDKLVFVINPKNLVWVRMGDKCWMGNKILYLVPSGIKDLEDVALESLKESTDATIVEGAGWYMIEYETKKGYFKVDIDEEGIPINIYRRIDGIEMKMDIEPVVEDLKGFRKLLGDRELSNKLAFPEELGNVFKIFDWFTMSEEGDKIFINGIIGEKWHIVEVAFRKFRGCVKYGNICVKSDPEVLKLLESHSN